MPFFQNPFDQEFRGTWILGDRQYTVNFNLKGNINSSTLMVGWMPGPYDLSVATHLTLFYALDPTLRQYANLAIDVTGAVPAATTAIEVAAKLNANSNFAALWIASAQPQQNKLDYTNNVVAITSKRQNTAIRAYVANTGAEQKIQFNQKALIGELPSYFDRHTIAQKDAFPDSLAALVMLDPGVPYQAAMITAQGMDPTDVRADWRLLAGRSGLFPFKSIVMDGERIGAILEYPAGAKAGDLGSLTQYGYDGVATNPNVVTTIPYTLLESDLVVPPE